jgi:hypothetical protein
LTLAEFRKYRHVASNRPPGPLAPEEYEVSREELRQLYEVSLDEFLLPACVFYIGSVGRRAAFVPEPFPVWETRVLGDYAASTPRLETAKD